jgi:hypothetical protein
MLINLMKKKSAYKNYLGSYHIVSTFSINAAQGSFYAWQLRAQDNQK